MTTYNRLYELKRKTSHECMQYTVRNKERPIDDIIITEATELATYLINASQNETPIGETEEIRLCLSSAIYDIFYGKVVDGNVRENDGFLEFLKRFDAIEESLAGTIDLMPWTEPFCKKQMDTAKEGWRLFEETVNKLSELHHNSYDKEHIRDTYDSAIKISNKILKTEKEAEDFKEPHLRYAVHDLFIAAVETTSTTMRWVILFLIGYPGIQEKLQNEIQKAIGCRPPSLDDIKRIPYMEAFLYEVWRFSNIVPLWIPYSTLEETYLKGYFIPKGSLIMMNSYSIHMDEDIWGNPSEFRPERFLTESNEINHNLTNKIAAFGYGKRRCAGEQFAKYQLFLFNVVLLQKCLFKNKDGQELHYIGKDGHTIRPLPYNFVVQQRN